VAVAVAFAFALPGTNFDQQARPVGTCLVVPHRECDEELPTARPRSAAKKRTANFRVTVWIFVRIQRSTQFGYFYRAGVWI
jgi:hypothetical protein